MRRISLTLTLHVEQVNEAARQAQAQLMMGRLSAAAAGTSSAACNGASSAAERDPLVILCGDFNDSPTSPACQVCCFHHHLEQVSIACQDVQWHSALGHPDSQGCCRQLDALALCHEWMALP